MRLVLVCLLSGVISLRKKTAAWESQADSDRGLCTDAIARDLASTSYKGDIPMRLPMVCTGEAQGVQFDVTADGQLGTQLDVYVDGDFQKSGFWGWQFEQTLYVTLGTMAPGLHTLELRGRTVDLKKVKVRGNGASCSLEDAAGFDQAANEYTYRGLDVVNRLFGESRDFSERRKRQLFFMSETMGTNEDGSISASVVGEGVWKWMLSYSQDSVRFDDTWGNNPDGLWREAQMLPWPNVSLEYIDGRNGQTMTVVEPCNTLSNLAFDQLAAWVACKDYSFTRDEMASFLGAFHMLAPGSSFLHACACSTGGRTDTFAMDWMMLQTYQTMARQTVALAGVSLTSAEKDALLYFGESAQEATDVARQMTNLFREKYDHPTWKDTLQTFEITRYTKPIAGIVILALYTLEPKLNIPGLLDLLNNVVVALLDAFGVGDKDFFTGTYMPAARKAAGAVTLCTDITNIPSTTSLFIEKFLSFVITFVEALVFQEQQLPVPDDIRSLLDWLNENGVSSGIFNDMVGDWNLYNGFNCADRSDHVLWHEKAAHGMVHALSLADLMVTRIKRDSGEC